MGGYEVELAVWYGNSRFVSDLILVALERPKNCSLPDAIQRSASRSAHSKRLWHTASFGSYGLKLVTQTRVRLRVTEPCGHDDDCTQHNTTLPKCG